VENGITKRAAVILIVLVSLALPAGAAYVTNVQLAFNSGDYIFLDNSFRTVDSDGSSPAVLASGAMKLWGASDFEYDLVDTTVTMGSQSQLNLDDSGVGGSFNPLLAAGYFDAGATISISGTIEQRAAVAGDPGTPIFTGVILEAYISEDDFLVQERDFPFPANQLKTNVDMIVTGGELYQGNMSKQTNLILLDYAAAYELMGCSQQEGAGFGEVEDFQDDIIMGGGSRVHFDAIPEPATLCLLGVGGLLLRRKRKITR
jgi:hypothetical protein